MMHATTAQRGIRAGICFVSLLMCLALLTAGHASAQQRGQTRTQRAGPLVRANGVVDWNRYYNTTETHTILRTLARQFPNLTELYSIGKSFRGVDLMVIEVTNKATGRAIDKPALYIDGGIYSADLASSAVALHLVGHLLQNYGKDTRVTELLDTRAFYIRPKFNPDGADLVQVQGRGPIGSVRPWDDDGDGAIDEDPPDDLDGNGIITQMRIPAPGGAWKLHPDDHRLLVRRTAADTVGPFYLLAEEGIDNDRDGQFNEDGIGGIDLSRNFPRNWIRAHVQDGAGPFALSEPEAAATIRFIADRPNITSIVQGRTAGGYVQRLPADDPARFDTTDLALVHELGRAYTETTGRELRPAYTDVTNHGFATLMDWAYNERGIIGWMPMYVPPDYWVIDYDGDGRITELEALRFNDEALDGRYFVPWSLRGHPQLGEMEVGGWRSLFRGRNPPAEFLELECTAQVPWILALLEKSPRIEVVPRVAGTADGRVRIDVTVRNTGWLPTHLSERGAVGRPHDDGTVAHQVVAAPVASIVVAGAQLLGPSRLTIGHLAGSNTIARAASERARTVTFYVQKTAAVIRVTVSVNGGPGGNVTTSEIVYR